MTRKDSEFQKTPRQVAIASKRILQEAARLRAGSPGRPGVSGLTRSDKRFLPSENSKNFETFAETVWENQFRFRQLRKVVHPGDWGLEVQQLADCLEYQDQCAPYPSLANAFYMRERRDWIIGRLHQAIVDGKHEHLARINIARHGWAFHPGDLFTAHPRNLLNQFRQNILNAAKEPPSGWLFAVLEASYNPVVNCYQFHVHGVATDGYITAINKLRGRQRYKPWAGLVGIPDCARPIVISRQKLTRPSYALGYILKSFWKMRGAGPRIRLETDEHVRSLVWLHRHRLEDITLLMNLKVLDGQLIRGK